MTPALGEHLLRRLDSIRDLYSQLLDITMRCVNDFSLSILDKTIQERSFTLQRIESEEAALRRLNAHLPWSGYDQSKEIRDHLAAIAGLDRTLSARLSGRMNEIARELSGLSRASNAAEAYTRHSRC